MHARVQSLLTSLLTLFLTAPLTVHAQQAKPFKPLLGPVTHTYLIRAATVVQAPGRVLEQTDVLIRDGRIIAVGKDLTLPFDAEIVQGDSLYVYAGFIDGLTHAGIPAPRQKEQSRRPNVRNPGNPPNDVAGIQPERRVRDLLKPDDKALDRLRELGFTVAHVVPRGRMLPGSGSLILLSDRATVDSMILVEDFSMFSQFVGGRGVYPATPMGMMAKWRQLYREARQQKQLAAMYAENPRGLPRPGYNRVLWSFFPIIDGRKPVYFRTDDALKAWRALRLQKELGFKLVLADLKEGWDVLERLKTQEVPVLVSLDLPEVKKEKEDTTRVPPQDFRVEKPEDLKLEYARLRARRDSVLKQYYRQASLLHEAGVPIAFTTIGTKPQKVKANLRKIIANGLSEEAALAALTTTPARFMGVDRVLGTVEPGKMANLVITKGPYFAEKSQVRYVFVYGEKFYYEPKKAPEKKAEGKPSSATAVVGTWNYSITSPEGEFTGSFTLEEVGGTLQGSFYSDFNGQTTPIDEIHLEGNSLTFYVTIQIQSEQLRLTVSGTISGDTFEGTVEVPGMGVAPITATRISGPDQF